MAKLVWLADIPLVPAAIIETARTAMHEAFENSVPVILDAAAGAETRLACVTLRWRGHVRGCWSGSAGSWREAIRVATRRALADTRRRPISRKELASVHVEVWLQTRKEAVPGLTDAMLWGKTGVAVEGAGRSAFFLPAVAIERRITDSQDLLERLYRKARLFSTESRTQARLFCTHWRHFAQGSPGYEPCELDGLIALPFSTPGLVELSASIGAHLAGLQRVDGSYLYALDPVKNQLPELAEHPVRLIGCTLALARLAQCTQLRHLKQDLLTAAENGESWIERHKVWDTRQETKKPPLLGTVAMALLAYAALPASPRRTMRITELRAVLLAAQRRDGSFASGLAPDEPPTHDDFGPPQALLALAQPCVWTADLGVAITRALPRYVSAADSGASAFFLAWHAKAWCALASHIPAPEIIQFADRLVDRLILQQRGEDTSPPEWIGGYNVEEAPYGGRPPSFLTALFTEAVLASARMRTQLGDHAGAAARRHVASSGLRFLAKLVIEPRQTFLLRCPEIAVGGVRRDLASFDLRCDYTMHLGTCLAAALDQAARVSA
ncbi:AMMECR1 domain-containing protein [Pseudoduganella sp. FT93W]|uniref:AMMECR1 domain-containing protein n=1 Tax=Duganella fentianensis TaxID=2692177 RepID=A0A845HXP9_9BURK|nr:AMMECR1 domain-containing protein [Duganella fentianensis]MYN45769.1 AMMECR1 domain-containing protein [Duganella fentianensis]